jgi:hypothetical protein
MISGKELCGEHVEERKTAKQWIKARVTFLLFKGRL